MLVSVDMKDVLDLVDKLQDNDDARKLLMQAMGTSLNLISDALQKIPETKLDGSPVTSHQMTTRAAVLSTVILASAVRQAFLGITANMNLNTPEKEIEGHKEAFRIIRWTIEAAIASQESLTYEQLYRGIATIEEPEYKDSVRH